MDERYMKLQIEVVVNKLLYSKNMIEGERFEETNRKLNKLLFEENRKQSHT